jgi:hypothetical protein
MTTFAVTRPNFVDGMLLTADDLAQEQRYLDGRLGRLGSRSWGVVAGMTVAVIGKDPLQIAIEPGCAIDAQGREIVLDERRTVTAENGVLCVYRDKPKGRTASMLARIRTASPDKDESALGEPMVQLIEQAAFVMVQMRGLQEAGRNGRVPLATIGVEMGQAPTIGPMRRHTGIAAMSWRHNGTSRPSTWWIRFSAPLQSEPPHQALEIRTRDASGIEKVVPVDSFVVDGDKDVFSFRPKLPDRSGSGPQMVFIRLACDFVLDWKGEAVSGAHLGGRLPSGNGVEGGVFESWFSL